MNQIKAILADADGTLIENGKINNVLPELQEVVREARTQGILFNLASGRPYAEQEPLHRLITGTNSPHLMEGILYEASAVRLFGRNESFVMGQLYPEQIEELKSFVKNNNLFPGLVPNENEEFGKSYVTPGFLRGDGTNENLIKNIFSEVKPVLELQFPYLEVTRSADAIDITAKGITKADPTKKYSELTGISLNQLAYFGDSGNDMPALKVIGEAGGLAIYVGKNKEQEKIIRSHENHFIPQYTGPKGTVQGIKYIMEKNSIFSFQ